MKINFIKYLFKRFPLQTHILAIILAYISSYFFYLILSANFHIQFNWLIISGIITSILLFMQLRIIDDIDDLKRDYDNNTEARKKKIVSMRKKLILALIICIFFILILNLFQIYALIIAVVIIIISLLGTFIFRLFFPKSLIIGSFVYESPPALIFLYIFYNWFYSNNGKELSIIVILSIVFLFFISYEFWKFSRKVNIDELQPYFLSLHGIRIVLICLLCAFIIINIPLFIYKSVSVIYQVYNIALPLFFLIWINLTFPKKRGKKSETRIPKWAGLLYLFLFEMGIIVEFFRNLLFKFYN